MSESKEGFNILDEASKIAMNADKLPERPLAKFDVLKEASKVASTADKLHKQKSDETDTVAPENHQSITLNDRAGSKPSNSLAPDNDEDLGMVGYSKLMGKPLPLVQAEVAALKAQMEQPGVSTQTEKPNLMRRMITGLNNFFSKHVLP